MPSTTTAAAERSYVDYAALLSPRFSASAHAQQLVSGTHDASDAAVDLSTPLSKVLFDAQEVDTHVHALSTRAALPLLDHAARRDAAARRVLAAADAATAALRDRHAALHRDVAARHDAAEQVRLAASRLWIAAKIARAVQRALLLARQLEANLGEAFKPPPPPAKGAAASASAASASATAAAAAAASDDHRALLRAARSLLDVRALLADNGRGAEGEHLARIDAIATLRTDLLAPAEQRLRQRAQQLVREFAPAAAPAAEGGGGAAAGTAQAHAPAGASSLSAGADARARTASACAVLYLLSPPPVSHDLADFAPALLLQALEAYLRAALSASASGLGRALAALSTLPRALTDVSARCRNVAALERLLAAADPPEHALLQLLAASSGDGAAGVGGGPGGGGTEGAAGAAPSSPNTTATAQPLFSSLLQPLLEHLDTASLASYFWRQLAAELGPRVQELLGRGGVGARQLRGARDRIRDALRDAVLRGCEGALRPEGRAQGSAAWEREVGVMGAAVVGPISR